MSKSNRHKKHTYLEYMYYIQLILTVGFVKFVRDLGLHRTQSLQQPCWGLASGKNRRARLSEPRDRQLQYFVCFPPLVFVACISFCLNFVCGIVILHLYSYFNFAVFGVCQSRLEAYMIIISNNAYFVSHQYLSFFWLYWLDIHLAQVIFLIYMYFYLNFGHIYNTLPL